MKAWSIVSILGVMTLAACTQGGAGSVQGSVVSFDSEPVVGWSYKLDRDADELVSLFSWPSRSSVVAVSSMDWLSDSAGDILLEVIDIDSGNVVNSSFLSRLVRLQGDAEDYRLSSMEDAAGNLLLTLNSDDDSHLIALSRDSFDTISTRSLPDGGSFNLITGDLSEDIIIVLDEEKESLQVLRNDLTEVTVLDDIGDDSEISGYYSEGIVVADTSSERTVVYEFMNLLSAEESRTSISLSRQDDYGVPRFLGDLAENYLFGSRGSDDWELLVVSPDSEVLEVLVTSGERSFFAFDFILVSNDEVFVIEEFRKDFSIAVYDKLLTRVEQIPLERVDEATFAFQFPEAKELGKAIVLAEGSFALLDTNRKDISRFRTLSDRVFYVAGLGFSNDSFLIVDRGELVNYDFDLANNWSFRLLDDEKIIRADNNLFLYSDDSRELFILTDGP